MKTIARNAALSLILIGGQALASPNLLFIYVDDLGYGDLASYGHPVIETPHLDALAASGVRLTNYYAPSALCSPSRAGVLTGRHPYRTGIKSWIPSGSNVYLRDAELTLAELLKARGYATALIGKWHLNSDLGSTREPQPNDQGFDYFYGHNAFQIPTNRNPTNIYRNREALPEQKGFTAELYAEEAVTWIEARADAPWMLFLSMAEPHTTIENPDAYNAMYRRYTRGEIEPIPSGMATPPIDKLIPRGPGEYYANITYMDAQLGRVLEALEKLDLDERTIVVFASDNGPVTEDWFQWYEVNAYGSTGGFRGRKHTLYEGGIRVPALVRIPGLTPAGASNETLVTGLDWLPTLAAIMGFDVPQDRRIDGEDISAALVHSASRETELLWALDSVTDIEFAFRTGDWKLLLDRAKRPRALYQLKRDPLELFDRSQAEPERVLAMTQQFMKRLADIEADPLRPGRSSAIDP